MAHEDEDGIEGPWNKAMDKAMREDEQARRPHVTAVVEGKRLGEGCWCEPTVVGDVIVHRREHWS